MTATPWVSLVALAGWLAVTLAGFAARRVGARRAVMIALVWLAIFLLAGAVFGVLYR